MINKRDRLDLIERVGSSPNLLLLDLSGNLLSEETEKAFVTEYEAAMEIDRTRKWPAVRFNARKSEGSFTPHNYMGSFRAMAQAGLILDQQASDWGMLTNPELAFDLYRESEALFVLDRIKVIQEGPMAGFTAFADWELPALSGTTDSVYISEVDVLSTVYGLQFTEAEKNLRAQMFKLKTSSATLWNLDNKKRFFKTLSYREQRLLLGMGIEAALASHVTGDDLLESTSEERLNLEAILDEVLERLFR